MLVAGAVTAADIRYAGGTELAALATRLCARHGGDETFWSRYSLYRQMPQDIQQALAEDFRMDLAEFQDGLHNRQQDAKQRQESKARLRGLLESLQPAALST